jgi:hypothetical protein
MIDADKLAALEALLLKERKRREEPISVIITGVPDADDEASPIAAPKDKTPRDFHARNRASEALHAARNPPPSTPLPASALHEFDTAPAQGPFRIIVQVRAPYPERGDHGEVAEGTYTVAGNVVRVEDAEGQPLGRQALAPGDDPKAIARSILRTKKAPEPFWAPINYSSSVH